MSSCLWTAVVSLALGAEPVTSLPPAQGVVGDHLVPAGATFGPYFAAPLPAHVPPTVLPPPAIPPGDPLFPYDIQDPWMHGYFQEIPAYGGHFYFRPYNYKHVLSQSQAAGGWGLPPTMPYSHQFWHRYHERATMSVPAGP